MKNIEIIYKYYKMVKRIKLIVSIKIKKKIYKKKILNNKN